jgi:hypothetical protein
MVTDEQFIKPELLITFPKKNEQVDRILLFAQPLLCTCIYLCGVIAK